MLLEQSKCHLTKFWHSVSNFEKITGSVFAKKHSITKATEEPPGIHLLPIEL
jgi:hypothetical protein